jgi:hypothetical protein
MGYGLWVGGKEYAVRILPIACLGESVDPVDELPEPSGAAAVVAADETGQIGQLRLVGFFGEGCLLFERSSIQ